MSASVPTAPSPSSALPINPALAAPKCLRLRVAGGPGAPARVRAWLQPPPAWLHEALERKLVLLTSELVNNSVLHGQAGEGDVIEIEVRATPKGVRAQVSDSGPGFAPRGRSRGLEEPGGWGLVLVERASERWGVERAERTSVWFELAAA